MIIATLAAAILLAETTPAVAAPDPATSPTPATAPARVSKVNRDGLVCHSEEVLGTRFPKKVCYTPAEEEQRSRDDQATLNQTQRLSH